MPLLPELQEMDDKQLNESLSLILKDFKSSSQNWRRFHFHSRFVPIREFVLVRRKSMFTYVCLILSF